MGREPGEKGVPYSGEVMVFATPEQMALFDADQIVNPQMGGAEDLDRRVYYAGGSATLRELNEMKEAGDGGMWRLSGGARRRSMKRRGRRSIKRRGRRSTKRKTRR